MCRPLYIVLKLPYSCSIVGCKVILGLRLKGHNNALGQVRMTQNEPWGDDVSTTYEISTYELFGPSCKMRPRRREPHLNTGRMPPQSKLVLLLSIVLFHCNFASLHAIPVLPTRGHEVWATRAQPSSPVPECSPPLWFTWGPHTIV
jgi:hypothetical protein